jgi:hypothetical protein
VHLYRYRLLGLKKEQLLNMAATSPHDNVRVLSYLRQLDHARIPGVALDYYRPEYPAQYKMRFNHFTWLFEYLGSPFLTAYKMAELIETRDSFIWSWLQGLLGRWFGEADLEDGFESCVHQAYRDQIRGATIVAAALIRVGDIPLLTAFKTLGFQFTDCAFDAAIAACSLQGFEWLTEQNLAFNGLALTDENDLLTRREVALCGAIKNGNLEFLQWVHAKGAFTIQNSSIDFTCVLERACGNGKVDILRWLLTFATTFNLECLLISTISESVVHAREILDVVWERVKRIPALLQRLQSEDAGFLDLACRLSSLDVVKWMWERGFPLTSAVFPSLLQRGSMEFIDWYNEECFCSFQFTQWQLTCAVDSGNVDYVKWLQNHCRFGSVLPLEADLYVIAISGFDLAGSVDMLKLLHDDLHCPKPEPFVFFKAVTGLNCWEANASDALLDLLLWIKEVKFIWSNVDLLSFAARQRSTHFLQWLLDHAFIDDKNMRASIAWIATDPFVKCQFGTLSATTSLDKDLLFG